MSEHIDIFSSFTPAGILGRYRARTPLLPTPNTQIPLVSLDIPAPHPSPPSTHTRLTSTLTERACVHTHTHTRVHTDPGTQTPALPTGDTQGDHPQPCTPVPHPRPPLCTGGGGSLSSHGAASPGPHSAHPYPRQPPPRPAARPAAPTRAPEAAHPPPSLPACPRPATAPLPVRLRRTVPCAHRLSTCCTDRLIMELSPASTFIAAGGGGGGPAASAAPQPGGTGGSDGLTSGRPDASRRRTAGREGCGGEEREGGEAAKGPPRRGGDIEDGRGRWRRAWGKRGGGKPSDGARPLALPRGSGAGQGGPEVRAGGGDGRGGPPGPHRRLLLRQERWSSPPPPRHRHRHPGHWHHLGRGRGGRQAPPSLPHAGSAMQQQRPRPRLLARDAGRRRRGRVGGKETRPTRRRGARNRRARAPRLPGACGRGRVPVTVK